jgi:hypothetical protein
MAGGVQQRTNMDRVRVTEKVTGIKSQEIVYTSK